MADNYYEATGVLVLDKVTPVIMAMFSSLHLDVAYPGSGEAYIARVAGDGEPQWEDVLRGLLDLATYLRLSLPNNAENSVEHCVRSLASHFGAQSEETLTELIARIDFTAALDLQALFDLAKCLDDGHGLKAIKIEGCWYCSKPRLFEFGGEGIYVSAEVTVRTDSTQAAIFGEALRAAILDGDLERGAACLATEVGHLLDRVSDEAVRSALRQRLGMTLLSNQ
ncbi:MAG: hypothetical protein IRZ28_15800 [Steroidobacteraceae bacterium]|nr:hypothetical protein [Steroidobacteraceae bacterium]